MYNNNKQWVNDIYIDNNDLSNPTANHQSLHIANTFNSIHKYLDNYKYTLNTDQHLLKNVSEMDTGQNEHHSLLQ